MLEFEGYRTIEASDGMEALNILRKVEPALVILDIMMPEVDGWTVLKKLRESRKYAFLPVVVLTALASTDQQLKGFRSASTCPAVLATLMGII